MQNGPQPSHAQSAWTADTLRQNQRWIAHLEHEDVQEIDTALACAPCDPALAHRLYQDHQEIDRERHLLRLWLFTPAAGRGAGVVQTAASL
jgi:hypothetical protein